MAARRWPWARAQAALPPVLFHLGDFKTGTTAAQEALSRDAAAWGVWAPPGGNQAWLAQAFLGPPGTEDAACARLAGMLRDAAPAGRPVIVSSEHFELVDPGRLHAALTRHVPGIFGGLSLVTYLRPHPGALLARFQESAMIGNFFGSLADYLDHPPLRARITYAPRIARWRAAFGNAFAARPYDRAALPGGDLTRELVLRATGTDPGDRGQGAAPNAAPRLRDLVFARLVLEAARPVDPDPAQKGALWTLGRDLKRRLAARSFGGPAMVLDAATAGRCRAVFADDAAATDAVLGGGRFAAALDAAVAAAPAAAQSLSGADHFDAETRRAADLWGRMLGHGLRDGDAARAIEAVFLEAGV